MIFLSNCLSHELNAISIRINFENLELFLLIFSAKQKTNSKRSLSTSKSLASKFLSQLAGYLIDSHFWSIFETVLCIFDSHVLDNDSCISSDSANSNTSMLVDLEKLLLITGKFWRVFLNSQKYNSFFGFNSKTQAALFHCLHCIIKLQDLSLWIPDGTISVVF